MESGVGEGSLQTGKAHLKRQVRRANGKYVRGMLRRDKILYIMLIPGIIFYILFHYVPMYGIIIAFKKFSVMKGILGSPWVGLKYFQDFFNSPDAWEVIRNTLLINIYELIFVFPAPVILALLLNELRNQFFKRFVQSVSYLPHFLSTVVIAGMVVNFLSPGGGIVNVILSNVFGIDPIYFLGEAKWFKSIYISSDIWQQIGWGSIIYLAALTGIDPTLYESARIDGANRWQQVRHITLAGIAPVIIVMFMLNIGNLIRLGPEKIILLYNPLVYDSADVIASYVYRKGLLDANFSFAAAVGLLQSVIGFVLIILMNKAAKRYSSTSLW